MKEKSAKQHMSGVHAGASQRLCQTTVPVSGHMSGHGHMSHKMKGGHKRKESHSLPEYLRG